MSRWVCTLQSRHFSVCSTRPAMKVRERPRTDLQRKQNNSDPKDGAQLITISLIRSACVYVVYAPIRDLPATVFFCCPVVVLEWNSGHVFILPPIVKLGPLISHVPALQL